MTQHVVHEMNGEDGVQLLSFSEVEELIHKADEASMMSQTIATVTSLPSVEVQEEAVPGSLAEITGLEAKAGGEPSMAEASADQPVTMVFMGYQSVEDEDETRRVLGLQGTVKAELVLIEDANGKTSPQAQTLAPPLPASPALPPATKAPEKKRAASNGETAGETAGESAGEPAGEVSQVMGGAVEVKKVKQPYLNC
ncbi:paralemmin-1-like isoform X2 [Plectropomus leopardus]|uniref:paralemmin-1-like isoform X2 n=1 Tax=Plectropomus leopardus TaxID=160734 RepID=UPI001C4D0A49|nr:paralemmin-1-like isoform X2 [Plectropomus leopardus]